MNYFFNLNNDAAVTVGKVGVSNAGRRLEASCIEQLASRLVNNSFSNKTGLWIWIGSG
jgi:hypothetical protein